MKAKVLVVVLIVVIVGGLGLLFLGADGDERSMEEVLTEAAEQGNPGALDSEEEEVDPALEGGESGGVLEARRLAQEGKPRFMGRAERARSAELAQRLSERKGAREAMLEGRRRAGESGGEEATEEGAEAVGQMSQEGIQERMEAVRPIARQCYLDLLEEFPEADGRVVLEFEVIDEEGEGRVEMASIGENSTLFDGALHECLEHHVGELSFESPGEEGRMTVRYPFEFGVE